MHAAPKTKRNFLQAFNSLRGLLSFFRGKIASGHDTTASFRALRPRCGLVGNGLAWPETGASDSQNDHHSNFPWGCYVCTVCFLLSGAPVARGGSGETISEMRERKSQNTHLLSLCERKLASPASPAICALSSAIWCVRERLGMPHLSQRLLRLIISRNCT